MADAKRDANRIPTLLGVSTADGLTPVPVYADPVTHRLLVDLPTAAGDVTGPSASVDGAVPAFNGTTGKILKDTKVTVTPVATGATITVADGKTINASVNLTAQTGNVTLTGNAAGSTLTMGAGASSVSGTNTGDQTLPVKATGAEIDAGTDDAKFATPKALADSTKFALASKFIAGAGALTGPAAPLTIGTAASAATGDFALSSKFIAGAGALTGPAAPLTIGTAAGASTSDFGTAANSPTSAEKTSLAAIEALGNGVMSKTGTGTYSVTSILGSAVGGTGNGFTKLAGPASTEKTWTGPNASCNLLTDQQMVENTGLALKPGDLTDGTYQGITVTGTAGETLAVGSLVYFAVADSKWYLADANLSATYDKLLGISLTAGSGAINVLKVGKVRANAQFPTFTIGAPVYMSETAGAITNTAPTTTDVATRVVGYGVTGDTLWFNPSNDYFTHT